jgi:ribonuclease P protein component
MREVVRSLYPRLRPDYDLVFIARPPSVAASVDALEAAMVSLLQRAGVLTVVRGAASSGSDMDRNA